MVTVLFYPNRAALKSFDYVNHKKELFFNKTSEYEVHSQNDKL